ncbi:hypothetical protein L541_4380, partial [Bordetella hinzii CA90 BAL1384]
MKAFAWLDRRRGDAAGALALLALALGLPFVIEDRFYLNLLFLVMLYGGLAS